MADAPHEAPRPAADADPDALFEELRRQISAVRSRMETHRETMAAAGLTNLTPSGERASWAPPAKAASPEPSPGRRRSRMDS
jgi:hypothetical protein